MKQNNSFNTSKPEEEFYKTLCNIYGKNNVIRQYKDERYPYAVDFYIKGFDFFIECNFHWTHGEEPYNSNNIKHIIKIARWKRKNTKYYEHAIQAWTERDVNKREIAKENNLNYLEIF